MSGHNPHSDSDELTTAYLPLHQSYSEEHRRVFREIADAVEETVRYGSHTLKKSADSRSDWSTSRLAIILSFRHILEMLDSSSVLLRECSIGGLKPILRSAVEAFWGMEYIRGGDSERRALAYRVGAVHDQIAALDRMNPSSNAGKLLRKELASSPSFIENGPDYTFPLEDFDTTDTVEKLKKALDEPPYQEIEIEWQRMKKEIGKPPWYALFDGPRNIRALARGVAKGEWYEILYRDWSTTSHASDPFRVLSIRKSGETAIRLFRTPEEFQRLASLALSVGVAAIRIVTDAYIPEMRPALAGWYLEKIQASAHRLAGPPIFQIIRPDDEKANDHST